MSSTSIYDSPSFEAVPLATPLPSLTVSLSSPETETLMATEARSGAFLGNRVFADLNRNGIQDDGDVGVDGLEVILQGAGADDQWGTRDDFQARQTTGNGGYFGFDGLAAGQYQLSVFGLSRGDRFSPQKQGTRDRFDSDLDPTTGKSRTIKLSEGSYNKFFDVGVIRASASSSIAPSSPTSPSLNSNSDTADSNSPNPSSAPNPSPGNSGNTKGAPFNYGEALQKSFLFYEAQRSGDLPDGNRIQWRGDSALNDGSDVGLDLSGGYFDAGDHMKYSFPMAAAMTMLSWGVKEYRDGYNQAGQLDEALDSIRWGTDYLLKTHQTDANGKTTALWVQVGDSDIDQAVLELPEQLATARPSAKVDATNGGTDVAAEVAAAMASASVIFRPTDSTYADRLLNNAIQLYEFAETYQRSYSEDLTEENSAYVARTGFEDELTWGALWIHQALKAQGNSSTAYLAKAETNYRSLNFGWTQDWDNKSHGSAVLLAQETGKDIYKNDVNDWLGNWLSGGSVSQTPGGLAWLNGWGSLRLAANTSFVAGVYADTVENPNGQYSAFAERQINYILGDNPRNSSYVVGFGQNSPRNVHHQAASGFTSEDDWESDRPNTNIIHGALVGGPKEPNDNSYADIRADFQANEVSLEYNAGFTGALARMYRQYGGQPLSDAELNALPGVQVSPPSNALASFQEDGTAITLVSRTANLDADLRGTSGDDEILGGAGNDGLLGLQGNDYLYGTNAAARGVGEKDYLEGGSGADHFVLGDAKGAFYGSQGWNDLAWIADFQPGIDRLVLSGGSSDYRVERTDSVTWIRLNGSDDAIAGFVNAPEINLGNALYT